MHGSDRKLARLFHPHSGKAVVAPLDHGVMEGMLPGLEELPRLLEMVGGFPVQGIVLNKGAMRAHVADVPVDVCAVVQLSGGTRHCQPPYARSLMCSTVEALRLGADMVAVQVNIANEFEDRMLADMGAIVDEAHGLGVPVLALIAPKGERVVNEMDPSLINHCIRLGAELGADVTGVPYSGDARSFGRAVAASSSRVLLTGGPSRADFKSFAAMVEAAMGCGASGTCIGRNVFQHPNPTEAMRRIVEIVHGREVLELAEEAMRVLAEADLAAAEAARDTAGD
ncbi:class I fructose-bisphosphate aldolase [Desulfovibrio sp. TomC]|uniref:class I fructose-bisphosphate aldolase n=1 Tax=Desulfovibrio sp. TomC TaxID=1562888 RepID=UPI000574A5D3|nr:fructose-bisphosphate aldolase [Desulfovibrio sp. TomC]KHK02609.1 2-amino-3,7-dideoxy-D-threo-hept-6-ulosonate synthase [Desulfovibrio sp. TomC]